MLQQRSLRRLGAVAILGGAAVLAGLFADLPPLVSDVRAQPAAGIRNTKHNFGSNYSDTGSGARTVISDPLAAGGASGGTQEVCVFCHTPHGANTTATALGAPLWNRTSSATQTYQTYTSSTLQGGTGDDVDGTTPGVQLGQPGNRSKLCLACHDGMLAVNAVSNSPGSGTTGTIPTGGLGASGVMPDGPDKAGGYTRNLGTDLSNDHPIVVTLDNVTAGSDHELRSDIDSATASDGRTIYGAYTTGSAKPLLINPGKLQCITCHDPHLGNVTDASLGNVGNKFLRLNRLQLGTASKSNANMSATGVASPPYTTANDTTNNPFNVATDQICVACHTRLGKAWTQSAHALYDNTAANQFTANEAYTATAAATRGFPTGTKVWNAGCLNCHDTHTATGARRLLRQGASGGKSAIEETCYQCHQAAATSAVSGALSATDGVPDIKTEFTVKTYRMPITDANQAVSAEVHDITTADFEETAEKLGNGNLANRHVECTDCHNPHRVVKADTFLGSLLSGGTTTRRTHVPARGTDGSQGNIASGALRGTWGVEPTYTVTVSGSGASVTGTTWPEAPSFTVKKGDPGTASTLPASKADTELATYVTREYQVCFKCHSNYAVSGAFPNLVSGRGTTPSTTALLVNGMTKYTNVAAEFAANAGAPAVTGGDQGEATAGGLTPAGSYPRDINSGNGAINHRSWHPVIFPTGRTKAERGDTAFNNIRAPFSANVGTQTMHCSDCHGANGSWTRDSGPNLSTVQGPHGSNNPFILRGVWSELRLGTGTGSYSGGTAVTDASSLCGNCHFPVSPTDAALNSGFWDNHVADNGKMEGSLCIRCHIAVPHGWKNKAFLVNKKCVGPEGGVTGCAAPATNSGWGANFNYEPYYYLSRLRIGTWKASRTWTKADCEDSSMESCAED